jgi:hypothetical protein
MHQQINLFQPVFRKQEKVFSATTLAQIAGAVLLLMIIILAHARWTLAGMEQSAQALQQRYDHLQTQMMQLEDAYRTPDTEALDAEIERLSADIDQRHFLLAQFDQLVIQNSNGFSKQFRILAEQQMPGLWLSGVTADSEGQIELRGAALEAKLVPAYLQQLEQKPQLSASAFETVSMTRNGTDKPEIQFVLRNHKEEMSWQ